MGRGGEDRSLSAPVFQRSTPHEQFCHLNELANGLPNHPRVPGQTPNFTHPGSLTIKPVAVLNECRCHSIGTSLVGPRHPDCPAQSRKDRIDDRIDMHLVRISCGPDGR